MRLLFISVFVLSLFAYAGQTDLDLDPIAGSARGTILKYDDGTPVWSSWDGIYRGVWFNLEDFGFYTTFPVDETEFWFYHSTEHPWDISDVYIELWNGDATHPITQLSQDLVTAVSYAPVCTVYPSPIIVQNNFWLLANTEFSSGGWPALLSDSTPGTHSFYSGNFIMWEPWTLGDFIVSVESYLSLEASTWAGMKVIF